MIGNDEMNEDVIRELIRKAGEIRKKAYCPYSGFAVGASLLAEDGKVYQGCNVENSSYGATICAERSAFFQAIASGTMDFKAIAIVGGKRELRVPQDYAYPCGMCRQVMTEFCKDDFLIIVAKDIADYRVFELREMMPHGFGASQVDHALDWK